MPHDTYDIVMLSDLRLPGGTTASMAEEIRAQAAAGYRTALVHVDSPLVAKDLGISAHLRRCIDEGLADLMLSGASIRARLAVLRHPTVFQTMSALPVDVQAETAVLVANNTAADGTGAIHYDADAVTDAVVRVLGVKPLWAPISATVRSSLAGSGSAHLAAQDWVNVIDVDEWHVDRAGGAHPLPVIGRHSRPQPSKWPDTRRDLLAAYPDDDSVVVRVLGGAEPARRLLGEVPERWLVEEFGARSPRDFLADVDFFVYFHRSDLIEAYGRTIMEAMASGAVVVLPEHFRANFGDAALYAAPSDVARIVSDLTGDRERYLEQSRRGVDFVTAVHGYGVHVERVGEIVGAPSGPVQPVPSRARSRSRARVMFVSSNGAGMGHLTRLLAMATRATDAVEPVFFSLSQAVPVVDAYGFAWEYCPSRGDLDLTTSEWNPFFEKRFRDVVATHRPDALVFDGTWPYRGMLAAKPSFPDLLYVWSRRGMWRAGTDTSQLANAPLFDLIVEPGEYAAEYDRGPTAGRTDAVRVGPITLVDRGEMVGRDEARQVLGVPTDARALLITLGAGNINDTSSALDVVADAAIRHGWQVVATKAPIARRGKPPRTDIRTSSVYPLARYLRGFDAAVSASGYNSFHELIMAGVPTAFVPNLETMTDDQGARATFAEVSGTGVSLDEVTTQTVENALGRLADPAFRAGVAERAAAMESNGAGAAMAAVEDLLRTRGVMP